MVSFWNRIAVPSSSSGLRAARLSSPSRRLRRRASYREVDFAVRRVGIVLRPRPDQCLAEKSLALRFVDALAERVSMPNRVTICRAMSVARSRSSAAPVEISPKTISSAARPPMSTAID